MKFKNYAEKWLSNYQLKCEKDKIAPTTVNNAKATIEAYLIPTFGEMDIRDINEGGLRGFLLKVTKFFEAILTKGHILLHEKDFERC